MTEPEHTDDPGHLLPQDAWDRVTAAVARDDDPSDEYALRAGLSEDGA